MTVQERIRQAHEYMEEALLLSREHMGNKVVLTKLYHAMMESLYALFDIRDMGRLTHADVINRFEREYARPGWIDGKVLDTLLRAYDLTHECDCEHMPVPTDAEVSAAIDAARSLTETVEEWLKRPVTAR